MNSSWGNSAEVVMAAAVLIGLIVGGLRWFYQRGDREGGMVQALQDNTAATKEVAKGLQDFKAETLATLRDHDWRIKILEDKTRTYEES